MPPRRASVSPKAAQPSREAATAAASTGATATTNSPARRKYCSWTGDNATRSSPSSQDVLLAWLRKPRNCARWSTARHSRETRLGLCREVVAQLRAAGIRHRTDADVYARLGTVERGFQSAKRWLEETALLPAFLSGTAAKEVAAHVRQLCSHYKELAPAFAATSNAAAATKVVNIDDDDDDDDSDDDDTEDESEGKKSNRREPATPAAEVKSAVEPDEEDVGTDDGDEDALATVSPNGAEASGSVDRAPTSPSGRVEMISSSEESGGVASGPLASLPAKDPESDAGTAESEEEAKSKESEQLEPPRSPEPRDSRPRKSLDGGAISQQQPAKKAEKPAAAAAAGALAAAKKKASKRAASTKSALEAVAGDKEKQPKRRTSGALREAVAIAAASSGLVEPASAPRKKQKTAQQPQQPEAHQTSLAAPEQQRVPFPQELAATLKACEEERDQRNKLFELECDKLLQELEQRKIQVVVETAIARKKLQDLGVAQSEVDRILPL